MTSQVERFYEAIPYPDSLAQVELLSYLVYHLTVEMGEKGASSSALIKCYSELNLTVPARSRSYLSEGVAARPQRFVKMDGGYALHRHIREDIAKALGAHTAVTQTSVELRKLELTVPPGPKREFLAETIDCFEVGANRATITLCWILAVDHLFEHILKHKLAAFNAALAAHPNKKLKVAAVHHRDDFTELPEVVFIELCRTSNVISNDVRKILDEKLGVRNSAAHPSGVVIKRSKVIEFVEDLVTNVVLKFPT